MEESALLDLPRDLGDGLVMRWATAEDAEDLAEFNFKHHNDSPAGRPEEWLKEWTRDLLSGVHPTTEPQDVTMVVDEKDGGKIVSVVFLISQTWAYDGIAFGCGMPELIATDEDYRRRGLVSRQMEVIHALSEKKGELVQIIAGIPWYYRQFGYEMALDLGGGLGIPISSIKALPEKETDPYRLRPARMADLPDLKALYMQACENSLVNCLRDDAIWRYEIKRSMERPVSHRHMEIIETAKGQTAGYVQTGTFPTAYRLNELVVYPGQALQSIGQFLCRSLKSRVEAAPVADKPTIVYFGLGQSNPAYEALGQNSGTMRKPYARYVRVPDLGRFLIHIQPVLERRLAGSAMAGYSGSLKLNFYTNQWKINFDKGLITAVGQYQPDDYFDSDAFFPYLTFLQLLFGRRDLEELRHIYADCYAGDHETSLLLNILFPKRNSHVINLN